LSANMLTGAWEMPQTAFCTAIDSVNCAAVRAKSRVTGVRKSERLCLIPMLSAIISAAPISTHRPVLDVLIAIIGASYHSPAAGASRVGLGMFKNSAHVMAAISPSRAKPNRPYWKLPV